MQKNGVAHESNFIIKRSYDSPFTGAAMLDFDELQEFPKMSSWATLWKCTPDQQFMEHLKLCHRHHHRKSHIQGRKLTFDLDFDIGSHT